MTIQKIGLDYFPLNVNLEQDDKFALIEAKYGIIGFGVLIKLYSKIYADKGYYCEWNEDTQLIFSSKINVERNKITEILNDAMKWKIFDKDKFDKYKIITSKRIQENYLDITKRRLKIELINEFLCIHNTPLNGNNVNIINQNVNIISLSVNIPNDSATQRKEVKEVKEVNNTMSELKTFSDEYRNRTNKENNTRDTTARSDKSLQAKAIINFTFETNKWENITSEDIDIWKEAYPACDINLGLKQMRSWLIANPKKKKKNYRRFITNWLSRWQEKGGSTKSEKYEEDASEKYRTV